MRLCVCRCVCVSVFVRRYSLKTSGAKYEWHSRTEYEKFVRTGKLFLKLVPIAFRQIVELPLATFLLPRYHVAMDNVPMGDRNGTRCSATLSVMMSLNLMV